MFYFFQILLFPIRFIQFLYFQFFQIFNGGSHIFIKIPKTFVTAEKTFFASLISDDKQEILLFQFINDLEIIARSKKVKKVSFYIQGDLDFGLAELYQIIQSIQKMKSNGIKTSGFASRGGLKNLYLLSYLDERYSTSHGDFHLLLPSVENFFWGGLFKKLGIEVEGFSAGAYKSYAEAFTRVGYSNEAKENLGSLIKSIRSEILENFYENTKLDSATLKKPILNSLELKEKNFFKELIDEEDYLNNFNFKDFKSDIEIPQRLEKEIKMKSIYFHNRKRKFSFFKKRKKSIAIVPLRGGIIDGNIDSEDLKSDSIQAYSVSKLIRELKSDDSISGVIFEIDSGGGSASASETIYQEILKLKAKKKVYAYFQNVSASGGYYIASACEKIYCTPLTITGSIGTVMIRPNLKKFYNRFGVTKDRIEFYEYRDINSEYGSLSPESKTFLREELLKTNSMFYDRVMKSRNKTLKEMSKIGEGRVFSGKSFLASNMIDKNISLIQSISEMKQELNLKEVNIIYKTSSFSLKAMIRENIKFLQNLKQIFQLLNANLENKKINFKSNESEFLKKLFHKM